MLSAEDGVVIVDAMVVGRNVGISVKAALGEPEVDSAVGKVEGCAYGRSLVSDPVEGCNVGRYVVDSMAGVPGEGSAVGTAVESI